MMFVRKFIWRKGGAEGPYAGWLWFLTPPPPPTPGYGGSFSFLFAYWQILEALINFKSWLRGVLTGKSRLTFIEKFSEEFVSVFNFSDFCILVCRFERAPVAERDKYYEQVPVKRQHTYRRLALEHGGGNGKVSECVIVRAHDRSLPLKLKMFGSANRAQKGFGSTENKEAAQDWDSPKVSGG
jgi:hypothetical protein